MECRLDDVDSSTLVREHIRSCLVSFDSLKVGRVYIYLFCNVMNNVIAQVLLNRKVFHTSSYVFCRELRLRDYFVGSAYQNMTLY